MSRFVVDASVAIKWHVPEEHSDAARAFLRAGHGLLVPDLLWAELSNILWKKVRGADLSLEEARKVLGALTAERLTTCPCGPLAPLAFQIGIETRRSAYDSLYVALALTRNAPMVTADRRLWNALKDGRYGPCLRWVEDVAAEPAAN